MPLVVVLKNVELKANYFKIYARGLVGFSKARGWVYSFLPYAYGIEYGRHRKSGKLARKAGGAFYITRARDAMLSGATRDLSEGLNKVIAPGRWIIRRMGLWVRRLARVNAPRGPARKYDMRYRLHRKIKFRQERRR